MLAKVIPDTVSPSQITVLGLVVVIQAWYYTLFAPPGVASLALIGAISAYWITHGVDSKHAKRFSSNNGWV